MNKSCDCKAFVNSRPLTYMSEKPDDIVPFTPSAFLQDVCIRTPDLDQLGNVNMLRRFQYLQQLWQDLRKRFHGEYLNGRETKSGKGHECKGRGWSLLVVKGRGGWSG